MTEVVVGRAGRPLLHWGNGVVSLMLTTPTGKIPIVVGRANRPERLRDVDLIIEGERNRGEDFGLCAAVGLVASKVLEVGRGQ